MDHEYYWSVIVEPGWIQAAIWYIESDKAHIVSVSTALAWETDEELIETANAAFSAATQDFPEDAKEPEKAVFGVPPSWVSEGQIAKDHLAQIKELSTKLALKPTGFVVLPEAIVHATKIEENSPFSGIVIGLGKTAIDVSVFRLGSLAGTVNVGRSVSLADDVVEALSRFPQGEHLPSRIVLYNGKSQALEAAQQELHQVDWKDPKYEKIAFLHEPQIELIDPRKKAIAVSVAGASEIGNVTGVFLKDEEIVNDTEPTEDDFNINADASLTPEDVGFALGDEVSNFATPEAVLAGTHVPKRALSVAGVLAKFTDIGKKIRLPKRNKRGVAKVPTIVGVEDHVSPRVVKPKLTARIPKGSIKKKATFAAAFSGAGIVLLGLVWWFYPKAEVLIYISPRTISEKKTVTFLKESSEKNIDEMILPGRLATVEVTGDSDRPTTGKKTVGDKAKGKITVRNGTAVGIKIPAGTTIFNSSNLKFSTVDTASVSAASSPTTPGTVTLDIVADAIGSDYNLAKDTAMKVSNYPQSEVDAVVETELSGGSSREIVAVSQADLNTLEEKLTDELLAKGAKELADTVTSGDVFVKDAVTSSMVKREFTHKVGDETDSVKLSLTLEVTGVVIGKDNLSELTQKVFDGKIPSGFVFRPEQIEYQFAIEDESDTELISEVTFQANLLPQTDIDDIAKKIAGKSPTAASSYLSTIPGYSKAEVKVTPKLPGAFGVIPHVKGNISVEIVAER